MMPILWCAVQIQGNDCDQAILLPFDAVKSTENPQSRFLSDKERFVDLNVHV